MPGNRFSRSKRRSSKTILLTFTTILIGSLCTGWFIFFEDEKPAVTIETPISVLGVASSIDVIVSDRKSGIRSLRVLVKQGELEKEYFTVSHPRKGYWFNKGSSVEKKNISLNMKNAGFADGDAQLVVEVVDFSLAGMFKGNTTQLVTKVTIDTTPPSIRLIHSAQHIMPGGSGIVVYQVSDDTVHHGVQLNDFFYPGYPIPEGPENINNAYIALSHDAEKIQKAEIVATDEAGNSTVRIFNPGLRKKRWAQDRINVGDTFLNKKLPELEARYPELQGSPLEKYLHINETIRQHNNAIIRDLCSVSVSERLWEGRFLRMPGSLRAGFGDQRTYYYHNKPIDKQVHLGVDIASTKKAEIRAANKGKVIYADYLGIYGNTVLLDHGQGVFSLYSHLTQIDVAVGSTVNKDKPLGLSGNTGMSGGDHLHFSILVNGVFVTPIEWWDSRWLTVTFAQPLAALKM